MRPPAGTTGSRRRGTWSGKARSSRRCRRSGWGEPPSPEPANTAAMVVTGALALVPAAAAAPAHLRHNLRRHRQVLLHSRAPTTGFVARYPFFLLRRPHFSAVHSQQHSVACLRLRLSPCCLNLKSPSQNRKIKLEDEKEKLSISRDLRIRVRRTFSVLMSHRYRAGEGHAVLMG